MEGNDDWLYRVIRDLQDGHEEETNFRRLFNEFHPKVYQFFLNRGLSKEDCKDLTQETFIRVYKGIRSFRAESQFKTWLSQITENLLKNFRRAKKTQKRDDHGRATSLTDLEESGQTLPEGDVREAFSGSGKPLKDTLKKEQETVIRNAVEQLPPQMKRCILLRLQGKTLKEIATLMKNSINTVKAHLHQANKRLKPLLEDYFDPFLLEEEEEKRS